eukprot:gene30494-35512_t
MFHNAYQSGFLRHVFFLPSRNGHIKRITDQDIQSSVIEICGDNVATTFVSAPCDPKGTLGIKLPFLVMIIKNMKKYFSFEVEVLDDKNSTTRVKPFVCTMPMRLDDGWNQIQFNLSDFTRRAYGTNYIETLRVQVHANCRIRRIYFSDRLYSEEELPPEYKLFLPLPICSPCLHSYVVVLRSLPVALVSPRLRGLSLSNSLPLPPALPPRPRSAPRSAPRALPALPPHSAPDPCPVQGFGLGAEVSRANSSARPLDDLPTLGGRADSSRPGDPLPTLGGRADSSRPGGPLDDTTRPSDRRPSSGPATSSLSRDRRDSRGAPFPTSALDPDPPSFGLGAETGVPQSRRDSGQAFGLGAEVGLQSGLPPRAAYPSDNLRRGSGSGGGYGLQDDIREAGDQGSYGLQGALQEAGLADRQTSTRMHSGQLDRRTYKWSEEEAAIRIQSAYRGFQTRKRLNPDLTRHYREKRGKQAQQLPAMPVIDINKLPRYGVLAPPIAREPKQAGRYIDYDRATSTFVKNRGILREGLEHKTGWLEGAPTRLWSEFTQRQQQRYVPIPPDAHRRVLPETRGDMSDAYDRNRAAQKNAVDLDFSFDVYYHSSISDPRCMAVVEVIMLERMIDGVVKGQYSLGWALLPLFKVAAPQPGIAGAGGVMLDSMPGKPCSYPGPARRVSHPAPAMNGRGAHDGLVVPRHGDCLFPGPRSVTSL